MESDFHTLYWCHLLVPDVGHFISHFSSFPDLVYQFLLVFSNNRVLGWLSCFLYCSSVFCCINFFLVCIISFLMLTLGWFAFLFLFFLRQKLGSLISALACFPCRRFLQEKFRPESCSNRFAQVPMCCLYIFILLRILPNFLFDFSLTHGLFRSVWFKFQMFENFPKTFSCYWFKI